MTRYHLILAPIILLPLFPIHAHEPAPLLLCSAGAPGSELQTAPESVSLNELGKHIVSSLQVLRMISLCLLVASKPLPVASEPLATA